MGTFNSRPQVKCVSCLLYLVAVFQACWLICTLPCDPMQSCLSCMLYLVAVFQSCWLICTLPCARIHVALRL